MNHFCITALGLAICMSAHAQQPSPGVSSSALHQKIVAPLFDNDGAPQVSVPKAIPANSEYRTRSGLYATDAQALAHERILPGKVISVRVGCCGERGIEEAMLDAWHQYIVYDASRDMPVFVRGQDLRLAVRLVDRLSRAGFVPVFLVTVP